MLIFTYSLSEFGKCVDTLPMRLLSSTSRDRVSVLVEPRPKIFQVSEAQVSKHPVSVSEIARETARNPVLAKALAMTQNGWSVHFCTTPEPKPFFLRKDELSVEQCRLMWGPSSQKQILSELHKAHLGVARSHVWWPGIDNDIEETARGCKQCFKTRKAPPAAPLFPWSWATAPRQRRHVGFATHQSNHFLIIWMMLILSGRQ